MIIYSSNIKTIIVLCYVCGVVCSPRPVDDGISKKTISSKNETNDVTNSKVNLQNAGSNSHKTTKVNRGISRRQAGSLETSIKTGEITANLEINDEGDVVGEIIIPDDSGAADFKGSDDRDNVGPANIDDGYNFEETTNDADDVDLSNGNNSGDNNEDGTDTNIQGTIELPDNHDDSNNDVNKKSEGNVIGNIEINDGDVEGTIEFPDEYFENTDGGNSEIGSKGPNSGNIDINDAKGGIAGDISGTIDINDSEGGIAGDISGTIDINDSEGGIADDISGSIEISDGEGGIEGEIRIKDDDVQNNNNIDEKHNSSPENGNLLEDKDGKTCWMSLNSQIYLDALDELDAKHEKARQQYQNEIGPAFDKQMMEVLLSSQGKAPRAIHQALGDPSIIPAGLNLGGYGMMRMQGSLLFFHRLKLRNNTRFQVNFLQANLMHMSLFARLSLHDLHLQGAYERTNTEGNMNVLYFVPNYGELNVLLKDVAYKMEGRLRMLNNRLLIELISSEIVAKDVLLTYTNSSSSTKVLAQDNIDDFVDRLKSDLDLWLKDYFNDYLMYFGTVGGKNTDIQVYEKQKTNKVNEYADYVIKVIKKRIRTLGFDSIVLPHLTITTATLQQVKLKSGKLRGFDSMYRRSVATTKKDDNIRKVDVIIGFSNLKVEYAYEAIFGPGQPVVTGNLVLSADELTAHLQLAQLDGSQTASINVDTILQLKSEALTVEGPANRLIANFKYILENPIIAIMTNVLKHNLRMLKTLPGCDPKLWGEKGRQWQLTPYKSRFNTGPKPAEKPSKTEGHYVSNEPEPAQEEITGNTEENSPPFIADQFPDRENQFIQTDEDNEWADYVFSKNDSVEIEAPIDGKVQTLKLERNENFILKKVP